MEVNKVYCGDCQDILKTLPENSVDSICCDPPYELGFMGKSWDNTGIANNKEMWAECLRVLKPGGHLLAFSGTRTYHRMASAIEDAGFEVRDMIEWVYGSGFPKSLNIGKAVDKLQGNEREELGYREDFVKRVRKNGVESKDYVLAGGWKADPTQVGKITKGTSEWEGWGTALKPAHEPICMARKPLAEKTVAENCLKYGTGGINIDESRVETSENITIHKGNKFGGIAGTTPETFKTDGQSLGRFPANLILEDCEEVRECFPDTKSGGGNKATKTAETFLGTGFGGTDNSVWECDSGNASRFFKSIREECPHGNWENWCDEEGCKDKVQISPEEWGKMNTSKSIIYQAKASKSERNKGMDDIELKEWKQENSPNPNREERPFIPVKNNHPTVKPIALMEYLIKMVTPKGGIVLDPFAGSGSTLVAAKQNGYHYIGIELTEEYIPIIEARLK